jgi:putative FmdB family regulatory protein
MPIYEYECGSCGHRLEAIQKMSELALKDCPACGQSTLKKLISAAGFQLKGSGWYATDFKDSGKKKEKSGSSDTPPKKKAGGGCGSGGCGCH